MRQREIKGYEKELQAAFEEIEDVWGDELPPFEYLSRVRRALAMSRVPALLEQVASFESAGEPLVVFSAHRAPIDILGEREGWAVITGDTSANARNEAVEAFQAGHLRGLAITIKAGGFGLTLTRASTCIFVDREWNPGVNIQAEDRLHRIGQTHGVTVMIMKSNHPLARRMEEVIEAKVAIIEAAVEAEAKGQAAKIPSGPAVTREELAARAAAIAAAEAELEAREATTYIEKRQQGVVERAGKGGQGNPGNGGAMGVSWPLETVREAIAYLRSGCDGAHDKDGSGFSRADVKFGWALAAIPVWDGTQEQVARALCVIYRRQLSHFYEGE